MNRVQEAIAEVLGLDEVISARETEIQELQSAIAARDEQHSDLTRFLEQVVSDNRIMQRTIEDLDYLNLFEFNRELKNILPNANSRTTVMKIRRMRHDNPLAKQGIRLIVRFTLGKGINWICKNRDIRDTLREFWTDPDNQIILTDKESMKEFIDDVATDGERFFACFEAPNAKPYLKLADVPMEEIEDIIYDPDNRRVPVFYKRKFQEQVYNGKTERYEPRDRKRRGFKVLFYRDYRLTDERLDEIKDRVKIPDAKIATDPETKNHIRMMHAMVNPLWTKRGRRGISELYASREWFRIFKEFMQDRAIMNRAASAVALKRKIKGGPAAVANMTGTFGGEEVGSGEPGELRSMTRPVAGAIYDYNEGVDLDWMKTDTGAANAKEDARMLLMTGGSGMGTNIHYFGEGGDANLATAQAMELPMVKNYEDWQSWTEAFFMALFEYVLRLAYGDNIPFENDRATEAIPAEANGNGNGTKPLTNGTDRLKIVASNGKEPARLDLDDSTPNKPTVEDVVSWEFPPIISKDVVKHMTAWAQLTQQVAPGDLKIKIEAIKGALTVLGVPNVDQIMEVVKAEEARLQAERDAQRQAMLDSMTNPDNTGPSPDTGGNGGNVPGFTKAGFGADAETKRLAKGKPSPARVGRVAADKRPGTS